MDPRLDLAALLEREANDDWRSANWFMDGVTKRVREKREMARTLRLAVALEREAAVIQAEADRELTGRPGRMTKKARAA